MTFPDLSWRDAENIIDEGTLPGRADLACVIELTAFMRASGEVEPAPPMRADLLWLIDGRPARGGA